MADPLNILIRSILAKLFHLEEGEVDLANGRVLQCIDFLSRSTTLEEAWQQPYLLRVFACRKRRLRPLKTILLEEAFRLCSTGE